MQVVQMHVEILNLIREQYIGWLLKLHKRQVESMLQLEKQPITLLLVIMDERLQKQIFLQKEIRDKQ